MTIVVAIFRTLGLPLCIFLGMLGFYEGMPFIRDIPYIGIVPVVGELATGRVATESAKAATAARKGYVIEARATAAEAKLLEAQRQISAGNIVISSYQEIAKNAKASEAQTAATAETRIKDYEAKLAAAGRKCGLDADDIRMLESQ